MENGRESTREVELAPAFSNSTFAYDTIAWPLGNLTFNWTTVHPSRSEPTRVTTRRRRLQALVLGSVMPRW